MNVWLLHTQALPVRPRLPQLFCNLSLRGHSTMAFALKVRQPEIQLVAYAVHLDMQVVVTFCADTLYS